jgi:hypothetical protein
VCTVPLLCVCNGQVQRAVFMDRTIQDFFNCKSFPRLHPQTNTSAPSATPSTTNSQRRYQRPRAAWMSSPLEGLSYFDHNGESGALRSSWKRTSGVVLQQDVLIKDLYSTVPSHGLTLLDDDDLMGFRVMVWSTPVSPQEWDAFVLFRGKSFGGGGGGGGGHASKSLECLRQEACVQKTQGNITDTNSVRERLRQSQTQWSSKGTD